MAKQFHTDFPYITKEEFDTTMIESPDDLNAVNRLSKSKFQKRVQRYSLEENLKVQPSNDKDEIRIVMLGKTGAGKSATGNTILGFPAFENEPLAVSVTAKSKCIQKEINGRVIKVMDTPGLHDTHQPKDVILQEISRVAKIFPKGVHAFLYIRNISDTRFTKEENDTLDQIEKKFGGKMKHFRILVYTYAGSQLHDKSLETYCEIQKQDETQNISRFLQELAKNIVAVDNKTTIPAEKQRNQDSILSLVDKVVQSNSGHVYTSQMFMKAIEEHKKLKIEAAKKGWSPELMEIVEMFIASDPDIVDREGELGKKVHQYQLQKCESDLRQKFEEQLESKMRDLSIERERIKELEEKQKQAEEKLLLKIEEEQKKRKGEQQILRNKLEQERQKQNESEAKWNSIFQEQLRKQEELRKEEQRMYEDKQKRLHRHQEEERMRFEEEKRKQQEYHDEMLRRYDEERKKQQEHQEQMQRMIEEEKRKQQLQAQLQKELEMEKQRQHEEMMKVEREKMEVEKKIQKENKKKRKRNATVRGENEKDEIRS